MGAQRILLSGNEAVARGAYEGGVRVAAAYPGTPSTEILETIAQYPEIYGEWSPNEKVAFDVAAGASMAAARSLVAMKHVGVNVAADSLLTLSYTGLRGGLVLVSADDPGMHSSQNEQDNRYYAKFAQVPMLEPSDSQEAKDYTLLGLDLSERFDTPVLLRLTTRISHSKAPVHLGKRREHLPGGFIKDPAKWVMVPSYARGRHPLVLERLERIRRFAERSEVNRIEWGDRGVGIITSGVSYQYAKEVLPSASFLKLGISYPLPSQLVAHFASQVKRVIVVEELEPFLEEGIRGLGIAAGGKEFFPRVGELTPEQVEEGLRRAGILSPKARPPGRRKGHPSLFSRPPVLCAGCPHMGIMQVLRELKITATGDIGCYTLAALPPMQAIDTCIAMGSSIGNALGMEKGLSGESSPKVAAVIGDSTFIHSGIPALLDVAYNRGRVMVILLDNRTTAMTGGQDHPGTGVTLKGEPGRPLNLPRLCLALGIERVREVDPYQLSQTRSVLREELNSPYPSVIITKRPCILLRRGGKRKAYSVDAKVCVGCQLCLQLGCPALQWEPDGARGKGRVRIHALSCNACGLCAQICRRKAIGRK
ncbi:MAG: indolepyruvate ferredoxin oxidoreductase subunit alpha [candidate division NC10 bacterium]|nr:indolepyruvate ferredoxin oxidoreductase subunit alpha [candidate division NC10 bacterium]